MRSTRSEVQERIRRTRDQAATAIAKEYGLRYVDMRALLERMTAEEIRRILEEQGVKRVDADNE
jgi:shikimate kinase